MTVVDWRVLPVAPSQLGESPFWHPDEAALYWCDITGRALHRWHPASATHTRRGFDSEPGCCAPLPAGALLVAFRDGLFCVELEGGSRRRLAPPPYDPRVERFDDGRADPQGRFWAGTLYEPRTPPQGALYRWSGGRLDRVAGGVATSNGLAFSPDGRTLYWTDTREHRIWALDFDGSDGSLSRRRLFAEFPPEREGQDPADDAGRPDGAAVDTEGAYWVAMYAGQRLLRLAPDGTLLQALALPVRCPTMPCFGGPDLRTLYVTTARAGRPADEIAAQPMAGCVFETRVDVPGLPVHFARP